MAQGSREKRSLLAAAALHGAAIFCVSFWARRHPQALVRPRVAPLVASAGRVRRRLGGAGRHPQYCCRCCRSPRYQSRGAGAIPAA